MVSVVHSLAHQVDNDHIISAITQDLNHEDSQEVSDALLWARDVYGDSRLSTGEPMRAHAQGMALMMAGLKQGSKARIAALLFALHTSLENASEKIEKRFGRDVAKLVSGLKRLNRLHFAVHNLNGKGYNDPLEAKTQIEIWRKMLLAMVEDIRVVLLRLTSRTQTMRYYTDCADALRMDIAKETLDLYAPLANRLGVWELKWELEDLSFRFLQPDAYKQIAKSLDEKRLEREQFIADSVARVKTELEKLGIADATVYGRPKHIYSIWNKMRRKGVDFAEIYDVRAIRVVVNKLEDCYTALDLVHRLWQPIPAEFDDYIAKPKGNNYQSLHTAVQCLDGKSLEIQIRTWQMHRHAELGVAAHWRYKENKDKNDKYDEKIALLRHFLTWKEEFSQNEWEDQYRRAAFNETVYVLTPQGKVIDLPKGATPVDFAYRIHTSLGHRCRGAKVDGALMALNNPLESGQCVEIIAAKKGAPSRDWLNPTLHYLATSSAKRKVRAWFSNLALEESLAEGRAIVLKALQRAGQTQFSVETLAQKFGFAKASDLYIAAARGDLTSRQFHNLLEIPAESTDSAKSADIAKTVIDDGLKTFSRPRAQKTDEGILIVGVGQLLTQLARCCKPTPGDEIVGFVTRGRGVSIHRADCVNFAYLAQKFPDRVMQTAWGKAKKDNSVFSSDIVVDAHDRQGLLRDISDVLMREKINVTGVQTRSRQNKAHMRFTLELSSLQDVRKTLDLIHAVDGVVSVRRA